MMKCPICKEEMQESFDYLDYTLMESEHKCPNLHYVEHFVTGNTEVGIKIDGEWITWQWCYNSEDYNEIQSEIEKAIIEAREKWNNDNS